MSYVLFDIKGSKTFVGISHDLVTLDATDSFFTPATMSEGVKKIVASVKKMTDKAPEAMAGGIRGILNEERSGIENDAILTGWKKKSITAELKKSFDVSVYLENDTAIAGLGEALFGAGKGLEIIAYHTVDEGVGGVKIENGMIDLASVGFEPGHQVLDIDRTILGDNIAPTLENLISASAIKDRYGNDFTSIPADDVLWSELAEYLAEGLRNTILYWSPDAIILGGALMLSEPRIDVDLVRKHTVAALNHFVPTPYITLAKLGDNAGLYGAMAVLKQKK
jgi:fructokinase